MPDPTKPIFTESQIDNYIAVTANDENVTGGFPGTNVLRNGTKDQWATNNVTGTKVLEINFASKPISFWEVYRHNLRSTDTIEVRFATSQANLTASPLYNSGTISPWQTTDMDVLSYKSVARSFSPAVTVSWMRISIVATGHPDGKVLVGRVIAGDALVTQFYPAIGTDFMAGSDYSILEQSPLGYDSAVPQEPRMDFSKQWFAETLAEVERINRLWLICGFTKDIAAVSNPAATTLGDLNLGVFRFRSAPRITWNVRLGQTDGFLTYKLDLKAVV